MPAPRIKRFNIRATERQERVIREGASRRGVTVSDFVLQAAYTRAQIDIADERHFKLPDDQFEEFLRLLDQPPKSIPALKELFSKPTVLDEA